MTIHNEHLDIIDKLINELTLEKFLDLVAECCSAKGDKYTSLNDTATALFWDNSVAKILKCALSIHTKENK